MDSAVLNFWQRDLNNYLSKTCPHINHNDL
jgi:hypothetical protein